LLTASAEGAFYSYRKHDKPTLLREHQLLGDVVPKVFSKKQFETLPIFHEIFHDVLVEWYFKALLFL